MDLRSEAHMRVIVALATIAVALAGCASPRHAMVGNGSRVTVAPDLPLDGNIMQRVSAMICAKRFIDPQPAPADALAALQNEAAAIGAAGIYNVKYAQTGLVDRCGILPGTVATAIAYR
jgi:hypothetical protein